MKQKVHVIFLFVQGILFGGFLLILSAPLAAQTCGTGTPVGVNLVCNGDFESGDMCFTTDYIRHSTAPDVACGSCFRDWSNPDEYEVTNNVQANFHSGFPVVQDHTPGPGNYMMAVDGSCSAGLSVWCQTVTVEPSTNYYFTTWLTSLFASNPARLQFSINGTIVGLPINAPPTVGAWVSYTYNWFSGSTSGAVVICIENLTTGGCGSGNDFAIDDISFVAGCAFTHEGPQPDLGPTVSLCGSGGSVVLDPHLDPATAVRSDVHYNWSTGVSGYGNNPSVRTISVSTPGTYSVCIDSAGSCIKSSIVEVISGFTIDLGSDVTLCNPTTALLDAVYTNGTTSYQWSRNGTPISGATGRTYLATGPGTYQVVATDASCGVSSADEVIISSNAAVPTDATFCPPAMPALSVAGTGSYEWYDDPVAGTLLHSGATYSPSPAATTTYYVKDAATFAYQVGPADLYSGAGNDSYDANRSIVFDAFQPFRLDAVTVYADLYTPGASFTIGVTLLNSANGVLDATTITLFAPPAPLPPNPVKIVVPVGFNIPTGTDYRLSAQGTLSGINLKWNQSSNYVAWPFTVAGVVSLKSLTPAFSYLGPNAGYGYFYNWEISAGVDCARVPVTATLNCLSPLQLLNFEGKVAKNNHVHLVWQTANEVNAARFVLQRSGDGINFVSIEEIPIRETSMLVTTYTATDMPEHRGRLYYRLLQFDNDGSSYTSPVIEVLLEQNELYIHPNPSNGLFEISFEAEEGHRAWVEILNQLGQSVYQQEIELSGTQNAHSFDIRHLPSGMYFIKVNTAYEQWQESIIKE
jgi:hypothetical protein